jgi:hypothetical protein
VDLCSQHLSRLSVATQNLQIHHPITPSLQTWSLKRGTTSSGNTL